MHRAADLPDGALGGARMALDARAGVLRADLAPATAAASFATGLLAIVAAEPSGVAPLELEAGGLTLRASSVGVRVAWTPDAGARVDPWLTSPRLDIDGPELVQSLDLAPLMEAGLAVGGPDALALPPAIPPPPADWATAAWPTLEAVTGAAMRAVDAPWAVAFAELAGWAEEPAAGVPRLSLEALVDDPAAETQRWTRHAVGLPATGSGVDDPATLARSLRALAEFAGVEVPSGTGLPGLPWSVPFPGLSVVGSLAGSEASRLASLVPADLGSWASGDPPLPLGALVEAVIAEASVDSVLADALAGRSGALAAGLEGLIERWAGTDGVVAVAADHVPAGLTVHRPVELTHTAGLDSPAVAAAVAAAIGTAPVRLVLVGVVAPGEPDLLPATGDTVVDLTAAGVAANTFSLPPTAAAGVTVVRLPGKADAVGPDGGAGFDAQVTRLRRALEGLAPIGSDVTVVAGGAAGRVAVAASEGLGITHVVTVATPWTELSLADVDAPTTGEAVRWLRTLLALADDEEAPADPDLALVRGLVDGLLCRDGRGDPLTELTAPARAVPPGLDAHAIVGSVDAERVRTAITALVARVVDVRIARRAADAAAAAVSNAIGVRLPSSFGVAAGGLRAALDVDVDVVRSTAAGAGGVGGAGGGSGAPADERVLTCTLRLGGDGRWLVGGPDPSRAPGLRPLALRALTIEATVPFSFAEPAAARVGSGRLVLHDAVVFGVHRARWPVDLSETGALLPEVRGLLGEVAAAIRAEAVGTVTRAVDPGIAALRSLLESVGLLGADGGFDAVTLAHLMGDPGTVLRAALAEPSRRERIAAAVRQAVGDTRAGAGATIEVAGDASGDGRTVRVDLSGPSLLASTSVGAIRLTASLERASATITADVSPHHAVAVVASCRADRSGTALDVGARIHDRTITLLPAAPDAASAIAGLLPVELRSAVLRIVLGALRSQLPTELPTTPAGLVDAILEAAGLLREADATGRRALRWADGLLADPREWVRSRTAGLPASVPAMLDAVRGLVAPALPATAGAIPITSGVVLRAQPVARGLRVAIDVDAGAFAGAPAELVLRAGIGVIGEADGRVTPDVGLTLGAAPGALAVVVAPRADGIVGTTVALRPTARPEVVLHPGGHGLTSLADAAAGAAVAALPRLLNALIAEDPAGAPAGPVQSAARLVSRAGRALGLADAGPDGFTAERIADFVADPVAALSTRASALTADGIALVVDAVDTALGSSPDLSVRSTGSGIELLLGPTGRRVRLVWSPGANTYEVQVALAGPAAIGTVAASAHLHGTGGLTAFAATLGPGAIPLGGVMLAPFARFATGATGAVVDIGLSAGGASRVLARITASGVDFAAELGDFAAPSLATTPGDIARAVLAALLELAGGLVLQIDEVRDLLAVEVGTADTPVRELLDGVLLVVDPADPTAVAVDPALVADLADPARLLGRLGRLAANLASGLGTITLGETLEVGLVDDGTKLGLRLDVTGDEWVLNPGGDILVSLVSDGGWLVPPATADGIVVTILERTATGMVAAPGLVVAGVGVRISRASGALLDAGLSIETLTMLAYGEVGTSGLGGGLRLELGGLGLPLAGATGGDNAIAKGVMPSGGTDDDAPAPKFSPALAVQRHPGRSRPPCTSAPAPAAARGGSGSSASSDRCTSSRSASPSCRTTPDSSRSPCSSTAASRCSASRRRSTTCPSPISSAAVPRSRPRTGTSTSRASRSPPRRAVSRSPAACGSSHPRAAASSTSACSSRGTGRTGSPCTADSARPARPETATRACSSSVRSTGRSAESPRSSSRGSAGDSASTAASSSPPT
ncbi:MAG TPA: hypothetical protein VFS72_11500 [Agromyces sp.]|nr:hypothetical protein [Agromyces sp.]